MSRIFGDNLKKKNHMTYFELLPFFNFVLVISRKVRGLSEKFVDTLSTTEQEQLLVLSRI